MNKIKVGILGATGTVGQKFVRLLARHPWFEIVALAASDRSVGKKYGEVSPIMFEGELPLEVLEMAIVPCLPHLPCRVVFSGLDSSVAGAIENQFASSGYVVISNARNHRFDPQVPLLIPEVNPDHLELMHHQNFGRGAIVTNPNCSVIGMTMALKPLLDHWGLEAVHAVTMQALSGAGYPGVPSMDIMDNVIPYIEGEEAKVEQEPLKIFGKYAMGQVHFSDLRLSAQCNRVAVSDGHLACLSVKLKKKAKAQEIIEVWQTFKAEPQHLSLPSAPHSPLTYLEHVKYPQPKLHRDMEKGMGVSIGRLRECTLFDWKFVLLSHNTIRGAAGCAVLNAELMYQKGYLKD